MKKFSMGFPSQDLEKISNATVHRSGDMGRLEKTWPGRRSAGGGGSLGPIDRPTDRSRGVGRSKKNIGRSKKNTPAAGSAKTFGPDVCCTGPSHANSFPDGKLSVAGVCFFGGVFFSAEKKVPDEKIFHGISVAGLRKNFGRDSASERRHGAARKNLAGSAIGGGRRPTREILGLKKKSSLQGLAGEVLTICKRGCFARED